MTKNTTTQDRWRLEFEIRRGVTFLNHASFGPVPKRGRLAVEDLLRRQGRFIGDPDADPDTFRMLDESRTMFAALTGCRKRHVAFAPNATHGLNAILGGLRLTKRDRILLPANEFPTAVYAVRTLAERTGSRVTSIPCPDGSIDLEALKQKLKQGADVLVISWVQYFNGYRNNLSEITALCHQAGCFVLVDVTQGAGAIPLNMQQDKVDAIVCGAQKWLLGQTGAGFFALSPSPIRPVTPASGGWLGYDWSYDWSDLQRWDRPAYKDGRFWESGTYPFYSVHLGHAGLSILNECGMKTVYRRIQELHNRLIMGLESTTYRPLLFADKHQRSGILSIAGPETAKLHKFLLERRIFVSLREGNIRVSPHFYNTGAEIDRLATAIGQFGRKYAGANPR